MFSPLRHFIKCWVSINFIIRLLEGEPFDEISNNPINLILDLALQAVIVLVELHLMINGLEEMPLYLAA